MASFDIIIARTTTNSAVRLNTFLGEGTVVLRSFEIYGDYQSPTTFKIIIDHQDTVEEQLITLRIDAQNKCYVPHYVGKRISAIDSSIKIIGWTDCETIEKDAISYAINFENNEGDAAGDGLPNDSVFKKSPTTIEQEISSFLIQD